MKLLTEALFLSGIIYDEKHFTDKVRVFFPKARIKVFQNRTDFYALVYEAPVLRIVIRGTDGTTLRKCVAAWKRNFKMRVGPGGRHTGFNNSSDTIMDAIYPYIMSYDYDRLYIDGHSAGGAEVQHVGYKIWDRYKIRSEVFPFASPPAGDDEWCKYMTELHEQGEVKIKYTVNQRDIVTKAFRGHKTKLDRGCDVGDRIVLPPDTIIQRIFKKISGVIEHSPREYADGWRVMNRGNKGEVATIKKIRRMFVN